MSSADRDQQRAIDAFRAAWREHALPNTDEVIRAITPAILSSNDYSVRRVDTAVAMAQPGELGFVWRSRIEPPNDAWVWELQFSGSSEMLKPSGTFGAFLTPGCEVIAIVHWREG